MSNETLDANINTESFGDLAKRLEVNHSKIKSFIIVQQEAMTMAAARFQKTIDDLLAEKAYLMEAIEEWAIQNEDMIQKTISSGEVKIGWRKLPERVEIADEQKAMDDLPGNLMEWISVKKSLDKNAIKRDAERKAVSPALLQSLGIAVIEGDERFFVNIGKEKIQ